MYRNNLKIMNTEATTKERNIHISGYGGDHISLDGLTPEEVEILQGCVIGGTCWVRVFNGKLEKIMAYESFPDPVADSEMQPFWQRPSQEILRKVNEQPELFTFDEVSGYCSPAIYISHLCAGINECTKERYELEANKLKSWGFEIMRSPRGADGKYWEVWYLPGFWCAKGRLLEIANQYKTKDSKEQIAGVHHFLMRSVSYGTLSMSVQKSCISYSDA